MKTTIRLVTGACVADWSFDTFGAARGGDVSDRLSCSFGRKTSPESDS